jgi:hypothetical protein
MNQTPTKKDMVRPCPFCGQKPSVEQVPDKHWSIGCIRWSCAEPYFVRSTRRLAIKAWNRRANARLALLKAALTECMKYVETTDGTTGSLAGCAVNANTYLEWVRLTAKEERRE